MIACLRSGFSGALLGRWRQASCEKKDKFGHALPRRKCHLVDFIYDEAHNNCFSKSLESHRRDIITVQD